MRIRFFIVFIFFIGLATVHCKEDQSAKEKRLRKVIAKNSKNYRGYNDLSLLLVEKGDIDSAIEILEEAIKKQNQEAKFT